MRQLPRQHPLQPVHIFKLHRCRPLTGRPCRWLRPYPNERQRPGRILADKAYSSRNREWLRQRGVRVTIPVPADQAAHRRNRGRAGGRPPAFDPLTYRDRNAVERGINHWLQHQSGRASRPAPSSLIQNLVTTDPCGGRAMVGSE